MQVVSCGQVCSRAAVCPAPHQRVPLRSARGHRWVAATAANPPLHNDSTRWWGEKTGGTSQHRGKRPPPTPELREALLPLATVCGADLGQTTQAVACLGPGMQQGVLNHGVAVALYLREVGCDQALLARLLHRCIPLFCQEVEKRAGPLVGQLLGLGLTGSQAARCFERCPMAGAAPRGFGPSVLALEELLESGSVTGLDGRRLLANLLIGQPAAAALLTLEPSQLRARADGLLALGLSTAELVAAVHKDALLLTMDPEDLAEQEAVLREGLGAGRDTFASMLLLEPSAVVEGCAHDLQKRVTRLVEELGQQGALETVMDMPTLLTVDDY